MRLQIIVAFVWLFNSSTATMLSVKKNSSNSKLADMYGREVPAPDKMRNLVTQEIAKITSVDQPPVSVSDSSQDKPPPIEVTKANGLSAGVVALGGIVSGLLGGVGGLFSVLLGTNNSNNAASKTASSSGWTKTSPSASISSSATLGGLPARPIPPTPCLPAPTPFTTSLPADLTIDIDKFPPNTTIISSTLMKYDSDIIPNDLNKLNQSTSPRPAFTSITEIPPTTQNTIYDNITSIFWAEVSLHSDYKIPRPPLMNPMMMLKYISYMLTLALSRSYSSSLGPPSITWCTPLYTPKPNVTMTSSSTYTPTPMPAPTNNSSSSLVSLLGTLISNLGSGIVSALNPENFSGIKGGGQSNGGVGGDRSGLESVFNALGGIVGSNRGGSVTVPESASPIVISPPEPETPIPLPPALPGALESVGKWDERVKGNYSFQIILSGIPDISPNAQRIIPDVDIYDVDLFMTDKSTIETLHRLGKTVICYFSGGTFEPGRPDSYIFSDHDKGFSLKEWPDEKWLRLGSGNIRRLMADRIHLSYQKGCDAIDPDNVDAHQERGGGGFGLTNTDSVHYVRFLSQVAARYGMATGLKNAVDILDEISSDVAFAINEECAVRRECSAYESFDKPVFHIEYSSQQQNDAVPDAERNFYCENDNSLNMFRTVIKTRKLDGFVEFRNGKVFITPTRDMHEGGGITGRERLIDVDSTRDASNATYLPHITQQSHTSTRFISEMIDKMAKIAKEDGYPFPLGEGSDQFIADEALMPVMEQQVDHFERVHVVATTTFITRKS